MTYPLPTASAARSTSVAVWTASWNAPGIPIALGLVMIAFGLLAMPAEAHHLMDLNGLKPTPLTGFLSGLAHPVLGPDHLLFLCSLSLVGLHQRARWMLALLATGLSGSLVGLWFPGFSLAEPAVALSLVVVALVCLRGWPRALLLPAIAVHGYVLSHTVLGWSQAPLAAYGVGLLLSQGALLLLALTPLRSLANGLTPQRRALLCAGLIGCGVAWTFSALVA